MIRFEERSLPVLAGLLGIAGLVLAVFLLAWGAAPAAAGSHGAPYSGSAEEEWVEEGWEDGWEEEGWEEDWGEEEDEGWEEEEWGNEFDREDWELEAEGDGGWVQLEDEEEWDEDWEDEEWEFGRLARLNRCTLQSAHPRVVVDPAHAKVRIALRYRARNTTRVGATVKLKGSKGSVRFLAGGRRSAKRGTLRLNRHLRPGALRKARAARAVVVRFDAPKTSCHMTMRLKAKRGHGGHATWSATARRR